MITLKAIGLWLLILGLAIANGGFRDAVLLPALPRHAAYVVSGLILMACVFGVTGLFVSRLGVRSSTGYALIGLFWLVLTLLFEFGFGLLMRGESLASLLQAYTFRDGNLWPLVLLAVAVAPLTVARLRHLL